MTILVLSMTQWWTTTTVHVSGDESVQDQIHSLPNGRLQCNFASRMVLIANHQVKTKFFLSTALTEYPPSALQRLDLPLVDRLHQPTLQPRPCLHRPQRIHTVHSPRRTRSAPRRFRIHVSKTQDRHSAPDPSTRPIDASKRWRQGKLGANVADDVPRRH